MENDICQGCQHRGHRTRCAVQDCPVHACWFVRDQLAQTDSLTALDMEILTAISDMVMEGNEPSDFELSFPLVRRIWDIMQDKKEV